MMLSFSASAGILESLSTGAYRISGNDKCEAFDEAKSQKAILSAGECLGYVRTNPFAGFGVLAEVAMQQSSEDNFFELLAKQQSSELKCSREFANEVSSDASGLIEDVQNKLKILKELRGHLAKATTRLATSPQISEKVCPLSIAELESERSEPGFKDVCTEIIKTRTAVDVVLNSIPLAQLSSLRKQFDKYVAGSVSDAELPELLKKSYAQASRDLDKQEEELNTVILRGAQHLDRQTRRQLLSDPLQVEKIKQSASSPKELDGLLCRVDEKYGRGAQELDTGLMVGSLVLTSAAGITLKTFGIGAKIYEGASAARGAGLITIGGARILQASAIAVNGSLAYSEIDKACGGKNFRMNVAAEANACVSAPSARNIPQENCLLTQALAVLGFGALESIQAVRVSALAVLGTVTTKPVELVVDKVAKATRLEKRGSIADRKLVNSISQPGVDGARLQKEMEPIWSNSKYTQREKVDKTFEKYIELRKENMTKPEQDYFDTVVKGVKTSEGGSHFNPYTAKVKLGQEQLVGQISDYSVLTHELEHAVQYKGKIKSTAGMSELEKRWTEMMRRWSSVSTAPSRDIAEFEAMGAQWDFLHAIPEKARREMMQTISRSAISKHSKEMLLKDIELSFLPRKRFIREVSHYHGYNSANGMRSNAIGYSGFFLGATVFTGYQFHEMNSQAEK